MRDVLSKAAQIQLIVSDVNGVLTDGRLYLSNAGNEFNALLCPRQLRYRDVARCYDPSRVGDGRTGY